ncbi:hypothetical protein K0M31_017963, partial [Melipona bicolor]
LEVDDRRLKCSTIDLQACGCFHTARCDRGGQLTLRRLGHFPSENNREEALAQRSYDALRDDS